MAVALSGFLSGSASPHSAKYFVTTDGAGAGTTVFSNSLIISTMVAGPLRSLWEKVYGSTADARAALLDGPKATAYTVQRTGAPTPCRLDVDNGGPLGVPRLILEVGGASATGNAILEFRHSITE